MEDYYDYYYEDDYDTLLDPFQDIQQQAEPRTDNIELESLPLPEKYRQRRPFMQRHRPYRRRRRLGANGSPYNFRRRGRLPNAPISGSNKGVPNFNSIRQSLAKNKFKPNPTLAPRVPNKLNNIRGNQVIDSARGESVRLRPSITAGPPSKSQCDYYTDDLCLEVDAYPISEIMSQIGANRRASSDLLADVSSQSADDLIDGVSSNQENTYTLAHYYGERRQDSAQPVRDFANDGGFLCPSEIKYAKPKRGKTAQGEWKDIVNVNDYTQTLRMEKCLQPGGSCSYVSHHYKSQCSQVYNYHRLLSWNKARGLHMDIYKVPTCCSCHIMGYSYVYPPLSTKAGKQFSLPKSNPGVHSAPAPTRVKQRPGKQIPVKSQQLIPAQPNNLPAVSSLDNFISDFNPQAELEQFMQAISDDLKDFNTFGSSSPRRQGTNGKFERKGPSVPSTQLTTQTSANPVTSFNNRKGISPTPQKKPVRNPRRPTPTPYKPSSQTFNSASTSSSSTFSQNYQTKSPFRRHKDKVNSNNRIPLVLPPKAGNRYSSIRRGDGFSESGEPQFGGNNGIGSNSKASTVKPFSHGSGSNPLNKYESIKLDTSSNTEKETEDGDDLEVVNYGYHPIIDFFNT